MNYPKRLIEVDLPIRRISAHSQREKSIRHGHISTLHIWWARRPLAACRAVICASLWPDPADPLCPGAFIEAAKKEMRAWTTHGRQSLLSEESRQRFGPARTNPTAFDNLVELRNALLDFIADFANWDSSTVREYLDTSRALTQSAHEALGGAHGTRPLVVDPFAGGGSIPLEALRVGAASFASDVNPVAVLLNKTVLEYIPKYGMGLSEEVRQWGDRIKLEAEKELADFYPKDAKGSTPIAYLWARTILCEGPGCGASVPLLRTLWIAKNRKSGRYVALRPRVNAEDKTIEFDILRQVNGKWKIEAGNGPPTVLDSFQGFSKGNAGNCPICGYTTPSVRVRAQLAARKGGALDARLIAVVCTSDHQSGRTYRLPTPSDYDALGKACEAAQKLTGKTHEGLTVLPTEPTPSGKGKGAGRAFGQHNYGITSFVDLYTSRQRMAMTVFARLLSEARASDMPETVRLLLCLALGRVNDLSMSLCRWLTTIEAIAAANGGQNKMPVVLDFVEANPLGGSGGDWLGQVDWIARVIKHLEESQLHSGNVVRSSAQDLSHPSEFADAFITDPPYYDAFAYSDLSDFFLVWLKRTVGAEAFDWRESLSPKEREIVVYDVPHGTEELKDRGFFQKEMSAAFDRARQYTKASGIGVIVFANKTTEGWEALLQSIIDAGWCATGSWPIMTERPNRQRAIGSAALGSSVHVVCRPREYPDGTLRAEEIGDWRDVLQELPRRIHEWMPRLADEGVVGADAIFACLGPALEIFSRYSRVETGGGEPVTLKSYLEHVWAVVSKEALSVIFAGADTEGFEPDARLTAMWLWTLAGPAKDPKGENDDVEEGAEDDDDESSKKAKKKGGFSLEYDAARKIAQGLGAHLEDLRSMVEVSGETARLLPVAERTAYLFGREQAEEPVASKRKKKQDMQPDLFAELAQEGVSEKVWLEKTVSKIGDTTLDRIHQSMILFAASRSEALKRFLVDDGAGKDARFWRLANALSALYPPKCDEKRWVDGVLARKKGLGL